MGEFAIYDLELKYLTGKQFQMHSSVIYTTIERAILLWSLEETV